MEEKREEEAASFSLFIPSLVSSPPGPLAGQKKVPAKLPRGLFSSLLEKKKSLFGRKDGRRGRFGRGKADAIANKGAGFAKLFLEGPWRMRIRQCPYIRTGWEAADESTKELLLLRLNFRRVRKKSSSSAASDA